jgi:hypothetical protein
MNGFFCTHTPKVSICCSFRMCKGCTVNHERWHKRTGEHGAARVKKTAAT